MYIRMELGCDGVLANTRKNFWAACKLLRIQRQQEESLIFLEELKKPNGEIYFPLKELF